jgi:succinoglycan biosynthesis transport protein ExoP
MTSTKLSIQDYLEVAIKSKWWLFLIFSLGTLIAIAYSYSLPPLYRSSTLILVEPQKVPTAYVSPTVTSTVQERLTTISQQILSRTNLEKIILQYNLYKSEQKPEVWRLTLQQRLRDWVGLDLDKLPTTLRLSKKGEAVPLELLVERMRKDIEVKVVGGGNAFTISYIGDNPLTVMKVTNTLAALFIEENLRLREQQAEGTSEFIEFQLAEAQRQLERQEQALREFKEKHMGALPGQMDANLRTLDRLQLELHAVNESLKTAEDRKLAMARFKQELTNIDEVLKGLEQSMAMPMGGGPEPSSPKAARLKEELARLQVEFHDNYPDIILLKRQLRELEEQPGATDLPLAAAVVPPMPIGHNESNVQQGNHHSTELLMLESEINSLRRRQERTLAQIREYERRVEETFTNEQNLLNLSRDYETSQRNYQNLLDKRLHAKLAENLEKRQKGEQFRILDPANLPQNPFKPDRRKIVLLGSLVSLGLGVGVLILKEHLMPSYRKPEDFHGNVSLPVLATIPRHHLPATGQHRLSDLPQADSPIAEQYRILYTRISKLPYAGASTVLAVSSATQGEGKTFTALNLALVMARDFGKKTLLIEGDLKNPALFTYLEQQPQVNLVDVLLGISEFTAGTLIWGHENLTILPALKSAKNSSSLLSSQAMHDLLTSLKERYDIILIDSPPILSLPDMNILERLVDGIILVVRAESTRRNAVMMAVESPVSSKLAGIVLNGVQQSRSQYYRYSYDRV